MKTLGIILLNYKFENQTLACLDSLQQVDLSNIDVTVYVVNNTSEGAFDTSHLSHNKLKEQIITLNSRSNLGFSGGMNLGITHALDDGKDYILILNNDIFVDPKFVKELLIGIDRKDNIGVASPKIYFAKGYEFHKDRYSEKDLGKVFWYGGGVMDWKNVLASHRGVDEVDHGQYNKEEETDFATGCCMVLKREILQTVGMFDQRYFLYYEDNDLSKRIKNAGFTVEYVPKSVIWHKNAGSAGGSGSDLQDYYITRNRLLFGMTYAPLRSKIALMREGIGLLFTGRSSQKKGVFDFLIGHFGKGSYL